MAMDPQGVDAERPHSFNRYAYAANNPLRYGDPDWRTPLDLIFLVTDVVQLGHAVYAGAGVGEAVIGLGLDAIGVISPLPGTGLALKVLRGEQAAAHVVEAAHFAIELRSTEKLTGAAKGAADVGRAGKQARLRELANDDKLGSADRGWIKQELNSIDRGQRSTIRNPPGKDLAHERGREAA